MNHLFPIEYQYPQRTNFLGFEIDHNRNFIPLLSEFIEFVKPTRVIELGTGDGGTAALLARYSKKFSFGFYTFDVNEPKYLDEIDCFGKIFVKGNYLKDERLKSDILKLIGSTSKCIVLCDGSNILEELRVFSAPMKSGHVILGRGSYGEDKVSMEGFSNFFAYVFGQMSWTAWKKN